MNRTKSKYSFGALLRQFLLTVLFFAYLISNTITMSLDVNIFEIGNYEIWLLLFLFLSLVFAVFLPKNTVRDKGNNSFLFFCSLLVIFSFIHAPFVKVGARIVYAGILCYLPCYIAFKRITNEKLLHNLSFLLWFFSVLLLGVYSLSIASFTSLYDNEKVLSSSYILLYLFPVITLVSKKKMQILFAILILLVLLFSNKRGSLVAGGIAILIYFVVDFLFINSNKNNKIWRFSLVAVVIVTGYSAIGSFMESSDLFLLNRLTSIGEDEGSGRIDIWNGVVNGFSSSSSFELFFGHGLEATRVVTGGDTAHNDYMEILYDYGLLVFIVYLSFVFYLLKHSYYLIKVKSTLAPSYMASVLLFLIPSFYSHIVIYPQYFLLFCMYWGIEKSLENDYNQLHIININSKHQ